MSRNKGFDQSVALDQMGSTFIRYGFAGTSLDDLVKATGVLRGSLYSAFGSKQGMFIAVLNDNLKKDDLNSTTLNLLIIAMMELTSVNKIIREIVKGWYDSHQNLPVDSLLGSTIIKKANLNLGDQR